MENNTPADAHDAGMRDGWEVLKKVTKMMLVMLAGRSCAEASTPADAHDAGSGLGSGLQGVLKNGTQYPS